MQERRNSIANALELRLSYTNPLIEIFCDYVDGLMQERRNSIANALELRLSYTNPLIEIFCDYVDGLMQERRNSIANALELHLSYTNPSMLSWLLHYVMIILIEATMHSPTYV